MGLPGSRKKGTQRSFQNSGVPAGPAGLYSEPEIVGSATTDKPWSVDLVSQLVGKQVTANLANEWPAQPPKEA